MNSEFDTTAFLDWLDGKEGPIRKTEVIDEWPAFPWEYLTGVTARLVDGDVAYYQRDLRRAAKQMRPID